MLASFHARARPGLQHDPCVSGPVRDAWCRRSCLPASACPKKHAPTSTLRLAFTPSAATAALPRLTYAWACTQPASGCPNLAAPGVTSGGANRPNLVRYIRHSSV